MSEAALVGVDWGTSSLRAALLDGNGAVLQERSAPRGILTVEPGGFPAVLQEVCGDWLASGRRCLVCGMAGSRQGWQEVPYCECPAGIGELAARLLWIEPRRIAIVPGLCCENDGVPDVMRGEEVQVFGAADLLGAGDAVAVLPGTHSKWVRIERGRVAGFTTFMTGETYALLRRHSILARTLPADDGPLQEQAFLRGIDHARRTGNLLRSAFSARTLALFGRMPAQDQASYLSGLVIGEELRSQPLPADTPVIAIGAAALTRRYELALGRARIRVRCLGAEATWRGLWTLAQTLP